MNEKTILVVDDDPLIRSGLQAMLQVSGYRTFEAEDGAEAKDLIHKHHPDLVILDMMMPRWGGFAVLEHFQNHPSAPAFIMLTAHEGAKHKAYARQIGVLDYLQKPYPMERLIQKIDGFFDANRKESPREAPRASESQRVARVLIVQQQRPVLDALQRRIEQEGYSVDTADDGEIADRMARKSRYDVIILGLSLAKIDGMSLLKTWRKDGIATDIIVLTAKNSTEDKVQGLNLGADDYVTKPFQMDELLARLRALVRRRPPRESILRVHDLEIDPTARTARRGGQRIHLTPREFELLHLLAQHRGKVVTRTMIWEQLYQEHDTTSSNVVDVYIAYLRAKVDSDFELKLILTRRGEGYMLRGEAEE